MNHTFDVEIAEQYGLREAILLEYIHFWVRCNEANERNFHDGSYWTHNSNKAFAELFPYMTRKQLRNALDSLRERGVIKTGCYNKSSYDKTLWYTLTETGKALFGEVGPDLPQRADASALEGKGSDLGKREETHGNSDLPQRAHGVAREGTPIPVNNQLQEQERENITKEIPPKGKSQGLSESRSKVIEALNSATGHSYRASSPATRRLVDARLREGFSVDDFKAVIDFKASKWGRDPKMRAYLRPSTLFSASHFEEYLQEARSGSPASSAGGEFDAYDSILS